MPTAEEIIVALEAEGADETTAQLSRVDEGVEKVKDSMSGVADTVREFANTIRGSMKAVVAGLAIAAAGLLSQVPVVGEVFAGLRAIVSAVAFQLDQRLRPILQPVANGLFKLAGAIADGDWARVRQLIGAFIDELTSINWGQVINNIVASIQDLTKKIGLDDLFSFGGEGKGGGIFGVIADVFMAAIGAVPWAAVGDVLLAGLSTAWNVITTATFTITSWFVDFITGINWKRVGHMVRNGMSQAWSMITQSVTVITGWVTDFLAGVNWQKVGDQFLDFLGTAWEAITGATFTITGWLVDFLAGVNWTRVGHMLRNGISQAWSTLVKATAIITSWFVDFVNSVNWGKVGGAIASQVAFYTKKGIKEGMEDDEGNFLGLESIFSGEDTLRRFEEGNISVRRSGVGGGSPRNASAGAGHMAMRSGGAPVYLDGRSVTQSTGRWRRDETSRRGRDS